MPINDNAERVRQIVRDVPLGMVTRYGDISEKVYASRNKAQAVGSAIKKGANEDEQFPWWRVVGANWQPTDKKRDEQMKRLRSEKVEFFSDGSIAPGHQIE